MFSDDPLAGPLEPDSLGRALFRGLALFVGGLLLIGGLVLTGKGYVNPQLMQWLLLG